ncbi:hypothetical protein ACLOJK_005290 [Asimina triloba]
MATVLEKSLSSLIQRCKSMRELKEIHAQIITTVPSHSPETSFFLLSRLLVVCATTSDPCSLTHASAIFHSIRKPNLFIYNAIIRAHANQPHPSVDPLILYKRMLRNAIQPNNFTFPFLLKACARCFGRDVGGSLHTHVLKFGYGNDLFINNAMVGMYILSGLLRYAEQVFDEMTQRDVVSWNSILVGYLRCGALDSALDVFRVMGERNVISWNSIITGFVQGGRAKEALALFHEMQLSEDGVRPDKITMCSIVSACASLGALDQGSWVHGYLKRHQLEVDMAIGTALIDMYGKCGCIEQATEVFNALPGKDVLAWTAMITAFATQGLGNEALSLLNEMEMQGTKPNNVTFTGLLCACAHAGLVDEGRRLFDKMRQVYSIEPQAQHHACMVDLLGRAGLFEEAEKLVGSMPIEPDVFVWGALLGSCRMHGNVDLGERVGWHLIELEPQNHAFYVVLSDIYARGHRFEDANRVRALMRERGIKKTLPGCSMIEVGGLLCEFSVRGVPEAMMNEIEWVLIGLTISLKQAGYVPNAELLSKTSDFIR